MVTRRKVSIFPGSSCAIGRARGPSTLLVEDRSVRGATFKAGILTVTQTKTKFGGVPLMGYASRNAIMFGAPNSGTGTIGRLIITLLVLTTHPIVPTVR